MATYPARTNSPLHLPCSDTDGGSAIHQASSETDDHDVAGMTAATDVLRFGDLDVEVRDLIAGLTDADPEVFLGKAPGPG